VSGHPDARGLIFGVLAARVDPPEPMPFSRWIGENIKLVDGPLAGEMWRPEGAPYLPEIADCLSIEHPCNEVSVRKSEQSGASILALAWSLYIAEKVRGSTLYGVPGLDALRTLNSQKLQPLIDAWQKHAGRIVIEPTVSRSGTGSTTYEKKYPGGFLSLANANAVMDLSMVTPRFGVRDELSKWQELPNGADPENLFFGRFTAFRRLKTYKILNISTPEVDTGTEDGSGDGHCRIDRRFRASDQRFWHVPCPECRRLFVHAFAQLKVDEKHPHRSVYECDAVNPETGELCGHHISEAERVVAVRAGLWRSVLSDDQRIGREPGFHIDAFISLMMSYGALAADWIEFRVTEKGKKDYSNVKLGLPYRFRGDAVDHMRLFDRREDYQRGHVPPGCLLITIACDVQMRGIYYEVVAWKPNRESFVIEADYLDGETTDHDGGAFAALNEVYHRKWPDAYGNLRYHDQFGIDANYRTGAVLTWSRGHAGVKALQGRDGWGKPALAVATDVDVDYRGRRIKGGAKLRGVGTWPLKSTLASYLAQNALADGAIAIYPHGYCHFGRFLDEAYFKQLTAEHLAEEIYRGRRRQVWKPHSAHAANHFLDCRIYNLALVDAYFASFTADDWARLAKDRGIPEDMRAPDLFAPRAFAEGTAAAKTADPVGDSFAALAKLNKDVQ
jgi:phage terminase large subunit GpA-like protein